MARRCTTCAYTTADPFTDRCPECDGFLAISSRTAVPRPLPTAGPSPVRGGAGGRPPWLLGLAVASVVLLVLATWLVGRNARTDGPDTTARGRIGIGMPVRQAVLALEPEQRTDGRVSLHDLLADDAPKAGQFTLTEGRRTVAVTFRRGKVTSVHETTLPFAGPRQVTIDTSDDAADRKPDDADDDENDLPIPPRRTKKDVP